MHWNATNLQKHFYSGKDMKEDTYMESMEQIYLEHAKTVYGFLLSRTRDSDLAEELTQETFFRAVKGIHKFSGNSSVSTWLCAIAKNLWREHLRKQAREDAFDAESIPPPIIDGASPMWDNLEILKAIHQLNDPMREVMYLRLSSNLTFGQIGEILGKSENWARVTYYRGKEKVIEEVNHE